jgi:hypothetical protein
VTGDEDDLRPRLVFPVLEQVETMQKEDILEIVLDVTGRWMISGPRHGDWDLPLRQVVAKHGGEILHGPRRLEVRMPTRVGR